MNKSYRLIWNSVKDAWVVVAETVTNKGSFPSLTVGSVALMAAVLCGALPAAALDPAALPTGGQIVSGAGSIATNGSAMTVTQGSQRMIANWSTFNIGQNASVAFQQPNASAIALNRIQDQNPSQIFGSLSANGQVWLLNSSGIIFGSTARVDVGGLVASSLNISNENFLAGKYLFENTGAAGTITNQARGKEGYIRTANGGYVAFLAPKVVNEGELHAPNGSVVLAAGNKVSLDFTGDSLVTFTVDQGAIDALVENKGLIKADGGMVVMTAKAVDSLTSAVVNNKGVIEAQTIENRGGRIILDAEGGMTTVAGTLDVSSTDSQGGSVIATGDRVWIKGGAHLTASGATGGGQVLVGGSWQNSDASVRQATGTFVEQGALLEANATESGNGGTVVAWSDITNPLSVTRAYGAFEAKGGPNGGNGGRIETSGHWLDVAGSSGGASAAHGLAGVWLFDPYNVTITGASTNGSWGSAGGTDTWAPSNTGSTILNTDINSKLEGGTNVTVTTNGGGSEIGDITVSSTITKASGNTDVTLTLQAANSIVIDQAISNTGGTGKLNVVLDADNNNGTGDGAGIVLLNNNITTNGGSLSFGTGRTATIGGVSTLVGGDVFVGGSAAQTLSTNGGAVDVKGEMIIANTNGLTINSNGGNVRFYGLLNSGNQYAFVDKSGAGETGTWDAARTEAINGTNGGSAVNDSYLVTITSRLENSVAVRAAGYKGAWIGAWRPDESTGAWVWSDGPEASQQFFTQTTNGSGGVTTAGYYSNFGAGEPNGSMTVFPAERVGQFYGTLGQWNDLKKSTPYNEGAAAEQYKVRGFVKETNLAASPLTVNAGAGTVTFSGAVGTSKALASLNVTGSTISINGGAVTTEGTQTYNGNVTLGAANSVLTQTNANTDFTIQTGKTITNAYGADASLTIKTTGSILMNSGSSISSSTGRLNTILWSDSDNSGSGYIFVHDGNTISANGGNIVMAGGLDDGANGGTASDGTPDGYAISTSSSYSGVSIGRNANAATSATTITSGGGNILMRGKSTGGSPSMGIHFAYGGTLDAGSGTLTMLGEATNYAGIELSAWLPGVTSYLDINAHTVDIRGITSSAGNHGLASSQLNNQYTHITAGAGGIYLYGHNTANTAKGVEISLNATTTGGGNITVESPNYIALYAGANAHSFNAGTGNTTLKTNTLSIGANHTLSGSGTLTVEPYTMGTTIGVAGGSGTLQLPASYFFTNFTNGFSGITIGNSTAGLISVGGSALSYNDPLTLKTGNSIFFSTTSAITGNNNALTLWTRAGGTNAADDGVDGSVWMPVGSSVNTGGGNVVIGGGSDPTIGYALGDNDATSAENNARYRGVTINGTLNAGGGTISIHGRGNSGAARGVSIGGAISTSGTGAVLISGLAVGSSDGLALGDSSVGGTTGTISSVNGNITLNGAKDTGSNGINLSTAGSSINIAGTGNLVMNATGNINGTGTVSVGGNTTLTAGAANISFGNTGNDFTGAVSVVSGANVAISDSNAMTLGAVTSTGTVDIATLTGDLTLAGVVQTSDATANAVKLNAGKSAVAGTAAGGAIVVSGGSINLTGGGSARATLFTGNVTNANLTTLVGSGNGHFRYNADETTDFSGGAWTPLGSGTYAVYREQPTVTTTANNDNKTYTGVAYAGGNGVTYSGFVNGDTSAALGGTLTYGGTSQGAVNAGSYTIVPSGYTNGLGYAHAYSNGSLTIAGVPAPTPTPTPTNTTPESVASSLTSIQNAVNGTQQDQSGTSGAPVTPSMGPGTGSTTLASLATSQLISQTFQTGGTTILSSSSGSTPITFSTGGATTTIYIGSGSAGESTSELATLPISQQTGNAAPVVQAGFVLREGASSLSVTITPAGVSPLPPEMPAPQLLTFSLSRADGTFVNLSAGVTPEGFLVITVPSSAGSVDQSQALLMAITVVKRELKAELKKLKGVVLVK